MTVLIENGAEIVSQVQQELQTALYANKCIDISATIDIVGSVAVVGAGNDIDLLVILHSSSPFSNQTTYLENAVALFEDMGYERPESGDVSSGGEETDEFNSLRKGDINIILTDSWEYREKWLAATALCKKLQEHYGICSDRNARVYIHQVIVDGTY